MKSLHSRSLALAAGSLLLCGAALAQGDDCSTGTPITGTGTWNWDNSANTTSGFDGGDPATCFSPVNAGNTPTDTIRQDLFYVWTVPAGGGDFIFDTENSTGNTDTKMSIHTGSDCNAVCLAADDDGGTTPALSSRIQLPGLNAGDQYLIQIGSWNDTSVVGAGVLNITQYVDPCTGLVPDAFEPNDSCAQTSPIGDGLITGLNVSRTNWDFYSFTVADGDTLDIFIANDNLIADLDMLLYDANGICHSDDQDTLDTLAAGWTSTPDEVINWTNTTGADVDCVLKVNIWPGSTQGDCIDYEIQISGTGQSGPTLFCDPANVNSSGNSVTLANSDFSGPGVVHLEADGGPSGQFGYFLVSSTFMDPGVPVSQGAICVGAPQGRYNGVSGANSVGQFDAGGVFQNISGTSSVGSGFDVPASLPNPPGGVITPGSTFHFQLWYRDGPNSNFSNGITVVFP